MLISFKLVLPLDVTGVSIFLDVETFITDDCVITELLLEELIVIGIV